MNLLLAQASHLYISEAIIIKPVSIKPTYFRFAKLILYSEEISIEPKKTQKGAEKWTLVVLPLNGSVMIVLMIEKWIYRVNLREKPIFDFNV